MTNYGVPRSTIATYLLQSKIIFPYPTLLTIPWLFGGYEPIMRKSENHGYRYAFTYVLTSLVLAILHYLRILFLESFVSEP